MGYSIGRKICEIRTEKKVSQEEIAAQLGISRQRFSRIENGQSEISYAMLEKAAEYLAVPVKERSQQQMKEWIWKCIFEMLRILRK